MYFSHRSYKQNIELISLKFMEISRALCNSPLLYIWYIWYMVHHVKEGIKGVPCLGGSREVRVD